MIADHAAVGLPIRSRIRTAKIATLEATSATRLGHLPDAVWAEVCACLTSALANSMPS